MIVNGYAYPTVREDMLNWWLSRLTWLSNFSYGIRPGGGLINLQDENLTAAAHGAGVRPMMVLTAMDDMEAFNSESMIQVLDNPEAKASLINNIEDNIKVKGLGGVDFDIEYLPEEYSQRYVELVKDTQSRLSPQGYLTTVALAPKTSSSQSGTLYAGHDYNGMGKAADYCLLMTYEWGYTYGEPQPVSPINNVRQVLEYGLSQIPAEKILMGLNNYGYDWRLPFVKGESRAETLGHYQAAARAEYYNVPIEWDDNAMAPFFTYRDPSGNEHIVWFENERSWQARIDLVNRYGLAGVSIWTVKNIFYGGI